MYIDYIGVLCTCMVYIPENVPPSGPFSQSTVQFMSTKSFVLNVFNGYLFRLVYVGYLQSECRV